MSSITKAEREAAAEAKGLRNPDGSDLYINGWKVKSARQAEIDAVRNLFYVVSKQRNPDIAVRAEHAAKLNHDAEQVIIALAHRNNTTVDEERGRLMVKVDKKIKNAIKVRESQTLR